MKQKPPTEVKIETTETGSLKQNLEIDLVIQRATQEVTDRYEGIMRKERDELHREMQNFTDGQKTFVKPRLRDRFFGRIKDLYLVMNHRIPVYCPKSGCPIKGKGVNFGIEAITADLDTALGYIDAYFDKYPERGSAKLIHMQVDRRSHRTGAIVNDYTFLVGDWDPERRQHIRAEIDGMSADQMVVASLLEDRKSYGRRQRWSKSEIRGAVEHQSRRGRS